MCGGKVSAKTPGLGDRIAAGLAWFGITQFTYLRLKTWLGLVPVCGCEERKVRLNRFGAWVGRMVVRALVPVRWLLRITRRGARGR